MALDSLGVRMLYPTVLMANQSLAVGQSITSRDGRFKLTMQGDGNLVLYWNGHGALWSTNTWNTQGKSAWMQTDGNFVVYTTAVPTLNQYVWSANTGGNSGAYLALQDDGNLVIYKSDRVTQLWSSNTGGH
jgi:hypothetical protein